MISCPYGYRFKSSHLLCSCLYAMWYCFMHQNNYLACTSEDNNSRAWKENNNILASSRSRWNKLIKQCVRWYSYCQNNGAVRCARHNLYGCYNQFINLWMEYPATLSGNGEVNRKSKSQHDTNVVQRILPIGHP